MTLLRGRIQPHRSRTGGSQTFGLAGAIPATVVQDDVIIESSSDPEDPTVFAVVRERRLGGVLMTEVVQAFGDAGIPQTVLQLVTTASATLTIPLLQVPSPWGAVADVIYASVSCSIVCAASMPCRRASRF